MSHLKMLAVFTFAFWSTMTGAVSAQQPAQKKSTKEEDYLLKLDPFVAKAIKANPNDSPLRKLQKECCTETLIALAKHQEKMKNVRWNSISFTPYLNTLESLCENLPELMDTQEDKIKGLEFAVKSLKEFEEFIDKHEKIQADSPEHLNLAKAARIDAEIELLKFKAEVEKSKK